MDVKTIVSTWTTVSSNARQYAEMREKGQFSNQASRAAWTSSGHLRSLYGNRSNGTRRFELAAVVAIPDVRLGAPRCSSRSPGF